MALPPLTPEQRAAALEKAAAARRTRAEVKNRLKYSQGSIADVLQQAKTDEAIGKLSLVGAGMRTPSGVSATLFEALSTAGVNIEMISTSEIRISVVLRGDDLAQAARVVHTAFGLDAEVEAVVHAGTGR